MSITRSPILPAPATKVSGLGVSPPCQPVGDLLLVGHGVRGPCAPAAQKPQGDLITRLRASGRFGAVRWGYLKAEPKVETVFDRMTADRVFILPMLMCDGYFARTQIPARLGLVGERTFRQGREIVCCRPLGLQEGLSDLAARHLAKDAEQAGWQADETHVIVVGHGSANGSASHEAICGHVDRLRLTARFASVHPAFLEEPPSLPDVLDGLDGPVLITGFFASAGTHAVMDIPGLIGARQNCRYIGAIGASNEIAAVVEQAIGA